MWRGTAVAPHPARVPSALLLIEAETGLSCPFAGFSNSRHLTKVCRLHFGGTFFYCMIQYYRKMHMLCVYFHTCLQSSRGHTRTTAVPWALLVCPVLPQGNCRLGSDAAVRSAGRELGKGCHAACTGSAFSVSITLGRSPVALGVFLLPAGRSAGVAPPALSAVGMELGPVWGVRAAVM